MSKAVYYCRVSTDEKSQMDALETQIIEAKECISKNRWVLVDAYVDEGKSGTQTKKRDEYIRLLNDIEKDNFDIIVIKSQDRLNRNTKDWYLFIDKLVTNNKKLFFYLENKFYTPDDALISGIKAILAEEYSRELSKKLNNAHKGRQEKCTNVIITSNTWGYDKVNKTVVVNEEEAKIVRLIYELYIEGYGSRTISKELSNRGIKSRSGNDFPEGSIRKIIRNPLFKGTVVMNKRHKDFNSKKMIQNPEEEWIYHENAVPAIISRERWQKANDLMDKKSQIVHSKEFGSRVLGKNLGKYELSSKIVCGECGSVYWRKYRKNKQGEQVVDWICSEYIKRGRKNKVDPRGKDKIIIKSKDGGCDNIHIKEADMKEILQRAASEMFNTDNKLIDKLMFILRNTLSSNDIKEQKDEIEKEKKKIINQKNLLLDKLLDDVITNDDYKRKDAELESRLSQLIQRENEIAENYNKYKSIESRIDDIYKYLIEKGSKETHVKKFIEHIKEIVVHKDHLEIHLDFYNTINIDLTNTLKKRQYVDSSIYLITHTDDYKIKPRRFQVTLLA